jgi:fructose-1-phosphate kinase PfkB-like protein
MSRVLVVGLNPAWQRILEVPLLRPGHVHRAVDSLETASGKGINAAKALARLGHETSLLQVLGGETGKRCLSACESWKVRSLHAWVVTDTRVCSTLRHEDGRATEIIEPFAVRETGLEENLLGLAARETPFDALLFCGSVPSGISAAIYGKILEAVPAPVVIWDSVMGLTSDLLPRISWLKVNASEYADLRSVLREAREKFPSILITAGPDPALVRNSGEADGAYRIPELQGVGNPIGAGDTVAAGLADALLRGLPPESALRQALALGTASCLSPRPAEWDENRVKTLAPEIQRVVA